MCAFRGVWDAILDEAHLRFHLVAAFYVLLFSPFFELSAAQYAVLVLLIAAVLSAELFNTAIENVCDAMTHEKNTGCRRGSGRGAVLLERGRLAARARFFQRTVLAADSAGVFGGSRGAVRVDAAQT